MDPPGDLVANLLKTVPKEPDRELDRLAHQVNKGRPVGSGKLDLLVGDRLIVELKLLRSWRLFI
jgi:hypothetical protein